jgi:phosphoribosyl 1,2-cyclic phosphodiesterase
MVKVTLLGIAQDGGVPQCGCSCSRCLKVHEGQSSELYPVSIGIRGMCL